MRLTVDTYYWDEYDEQWYYGGELELATREIRYIDFDMEGKSRFGRLVELNLNSLRDYKVYYIKREDGVYLHNNFLV
jgi:hypothetical protein